MWDLAVKVEPGLELVFLADSEYNQDRRVLCSDYLVKGCVVGSGKRIKVRSVELLAIQYHTPDQACRAAKAVDQWYAYNWLFDDVTNEPVLEDFIRKAFGGRRADKNVECR